MNQTEGFAEPTGEPTTNLGNLVANAHNGVEPLESYGDIDQGTVEHELISENMVIDPTLNGYHYTKMTLYYLLRYATAVTEQLDEKNPIGARILGLISSVAFYMQTCSQMCLKYARNTAPTGKYKTGYRSVSRIQKTPTGSLMANTNASAKQVMGDFSNISGVKEVNDYLEASFLRFRSHNEREAVKAFRSLKDSFGKLGKRCAERANVFFNDATPLNLKTAPPSAIRGAQSARYRNLTNRVDQHEDCNSKFKHLRNYIYVYDNRTNNTNDVATKMENIKFGADPNFEVALEVEGDLSPDCPFWQLCKNDFLLAREDEDIGEIDDLDIPKIQAKLDKLITEYVGTFTV